MRTALADYGISFDKSCNYAFKFGSQKMGSHSIADHAKCFSVSQASFPAHYHRIGQPLELSGGSQPARETSKQWSQ